MIISRHMEILLNLSAISGEHDLRGLRRLYNEVEANVWSLNALRVEQGSYGTRLMSMLLTKLLPEIRLIVTRKASGEDLNLETLLTVVEEELIAREHSHDPAQNNCHLQERSRPSPTATTLLSGTCESNKGSMIVCRYCQQSHPSVDCHVVTGPEARKQILRPPEDVSIALCRGTLGRSSHICQTCKKKKPSKHLRPDCCNWSAESSKPHRAY